MGFLCPKINYQEHRHLQSQFREKLDYFPSPFQYFENYRLYKRKFCVITCHLSLNPNTVAIHVEYSTLSNLKDGK